ncbi:hypothetical protein AMK59_83, partial [Oryctes borbonicus]
AMVTCPTPPSVAHGITKIISGFQLESALSGTEIEISCVPKYHNIKAPCKPSRLKCIGGDWIGILPICVYSKECPPPPDVRHATPFDINAARYEAKMQRFFINTQISYQCLPGYEMRGNDILTCSSGCWTPSEPPVCHNLEETYIESNAGGQIVLSLATGTGVLLLLVVICLVIVCRRRKPLSRAVSIQPSVPRPDLADHAALLHHPDRLALIAFADGIQSGQPALPTYEEAIRDRVPGCTSTRIPRPHWPSLVARRSRNSPNPDSIHVTRQGSFASHSASIRSDPMGSTDTMAVSENSTTVTLDTASSHSGSQPASCRAHCGSLASFDTSSVLNTEGVPLLEENELEEVQCGDDVSLAMENRSMTDNVSFKLSITSDVA